MIQKAIHHLVEGQNLDYEGAKEVMDEIMSGGRLPGPDIRISDGAADEGRDHRRDHRLRDGDAGKSGAAEPAVPGNGHCGHRRRRGRHL